MSDYEQYITAVNKIFDYIAKMKTGWNSQDNVSYIESIEEYKQTVISHVDTFKNGGSTSQINETPAQAEEQPSTEEQAAPDVSTESNEETAPAEEGNTQPEMGALGND